MSGTTRAPTAAIATREVVAARLRAALEGRGDVRVGVLFGSVARERAGADSDVDIAVDAPGMDLLALAADLSLAVGRDVHVVALQDAGYPLLAALVRDGIVVAEHPHGAGADWRTRAILQVETDLPWYERMRDRYLARLATGAR